jgi:prevent-host-death family protein
MDLRRRLGEILDAASAGEPITIERDGRPMAVLVTPEAAARLNETERARIERGLAALDRLDAFRERMARLYPEPDDGLTTVEWLRRERDARDDRIAEAAIRSLDEPPGDQGEEDR